MAHLIKGIDITLYSKTQVGMDAFRAPVYEETPITVKNVLVTPVSADAVTEGIQRYGKRAVYELCIPKGDPHIWENRRVEFFGQSFQTFGPVTEYIESMLPLDWNKKVKVEKYG